MTSIEERKHQDKKTVKASRKLTNISQHAATSGNDAYSINILSLNDDVFQEILSHLSFDEVAKLRLVSRHFNDICQKVLNKGFLAVQRYHSRCLREMKAKLPRRESERRTHPLARHIDVLTGIETRLSLLSMTYYKYTVLGAFCFIPGKVLDECYRVLREVVVHKNPPKSYELLQELRDISSMAMEHFEEHIVPTMKKNHPMLGSTGLRNASPRFMRCLADAEETEHDSVSLPSSSTFATPQMTPIRSLNGFVRTVNSSITSGASSAASTSSNLKLELVVNNTRAVVNAQKKQIAELKAKVDEQSRKMNEQGRLLNEYGRKLKELEQKLSSRDTDESVQPSPGQSAIDTPPPSAKKRPAIESSDSPDGGHPSIKRKMVTEKKGKKSVTAFAMSLRKRN